MEAEVKVNGAARTEKAFAKAVKRFRTDIRADLQDWGNETAGMARKDHKYKRQTGNLDRSIQAELRGDSVRIWINPQYVTNNGYNYGLIQHDGSKYIHGDPFIERAVERNVGKLTEKIGNTIAELLGD